LGGGNEAKFADAAFDQGGEGIINHGFIVNGLELLAGHQGEWIETGPCPTSENNAFHGISLRVFGPNAKRNLVGHPPATGRLTKSGGNN
jgi:hypothetical protein